MSPWSMGFYYDESHSDLCALQFDPCIPLCIHSCIYYFGQGYSTIFSYSQHKSKCLLQAVCLNVAALSTQFKSTAILSAFGYWKIPMI